MDSKSSWKISHLFLATGFVLILLMGTQQLVNCFTINNSTDVDNSNLSDSDESVEDSLKTRAVQWDDRNSAPVPVQNPAAGINIHMQGPGGMGPSEGIPFQRFLPFTQSGVCERGTVYRITEGGDLLKSPQELECIFFSGIPPSKVPTGPLHGTVLSALNMELFNRIVNLVWWGKIIKEVNCPPPPPTSPIQQGPTPVQSLRSRPIYIGWNNVLDHLMVPFLARVDPLQENLINGEYNDGKTNFIIDYTQEFSTACANFDALRRSQRMNIPPRNLYPLNQAVDAIRLVGRQRDGGSILLGKTYLRDTSHVSSTVVYFYFISYDRELEPWFQVGQQLPPLENSFSFNIPGFGPN